MDQIKFKTETGLFWYNDIIYEQDISGKAKLIYLYLCRCADSERRCYPSYRRIRENCCLKSNATISRALKELYAIGLVKKKTRRGGGKTSNLYFLYDEPTGSDVCPSCGYSNY